MKKNKHLFSVMTKIYEWNLQVSKNTQIIKTTSSLTSYKLDYILSLIFWWCRNIVQAAVYSLPIISWVTSRSLWPSRILQLQCFEITAADQDLLDFLFLLSGFPTQFAQQLFIFSNFGLLVFNDLVQVCYSNCAGGPTALFLSARPPPRHNDTGGVRANR